MMVQPAAKCSIQKLRAAKEVAMAVAMEAARAARAPA
jgi:hypothetical protein